MAVIPSDEKLYKNADENDVSNGGYVENVGGATPAPKQERRSIPAPGLTGAAGRGGVDGKDVVDGRIRG